MNETERRTQLVHKTISRVTSGIGPTAIAKLIGEPWCNAGGQPQSSAIMSHLRRLLKQGLIESAGIGWYKVKQ